MLRAVLFDLDDTLLGNSMDVFLGSYFQLLGSYVDPVMEKDAFLAELMIGSQAMISNQDRSLTNREVFWTIFCQRTGRQREDIESLTDRFYKERFGELRPLTSRRPWAPTLVTFCVDLGLKVVIATNPLFPRSAIEQRLAWAGVPVTDYEYELVTTYENMHTTKPNIGYYEEILSQIDVPPGEALMVGDDLKNDIKPAKKLGLFTFWIGDSDGESDFEAIESGSRADASGSLAVLHDRLSAGWILS